MALHTYSGIGFGGEVAPNLEAITDALGIHGARSVTTGREEEGVTGVGAFSSSSLLERFELEALGSSSWGRRDPVTGSCTTAAGYRGRDFPVLHGDITDDRLIVSRHATVGVPHRRTLEDRLRGSGLILHALRIL
ncbi:hypothetical protein PC110_g18433 [Phytophthora cactorum]|uniref:Uncharacterized protein n=1 Tax=Phytophthora cactorum TaxID=29920 RepID=A0A329RPS8_9STRA|nr:hypothetical protein PC110_g18433 [Phytophthora cactorum]